MIALAVLGLRAAAAAWSPSEEERRKALFSYLREGVPFLPWDNLPRGAAISCPSIEKSLTTETYSDRILGDRRLGRLRPIRFKFSRAITLRRGATSSRARFACGWRLIGPTPRTGRSRIPTRSLGPKRTAAASCGHFIQFCSAIRAYTTATSSKPPRASRRGGIWWAPPSNMPQRSMRGLSRTR